MGYLKTIRIILMVILFFICIGQLTTANQPRADGGGVTSGIGESQTYGNPPINPPVDTSGTGEEFNGGGVTGGVGESQTYGNPPINPPVDTSSPGEEFNGEGVTSGIGETTGSLAWDFYIFLISLIILIASFFFLFQAKAMVEWIFRDEKGAPDPYAGVFISSVVSALILLFWVVFRPMVLNSEPVENFIVEMFYNPRDVTPGILLAAILPATVGFIKFITVVAAYQRKTSDSSGYQRSYVVLLVYMAINLLTVAASIVTLIPLLSKIF